MPHPELAIRPGQVFSGQVFSGQVLAKYAEAEVELDHDDCTLVGIGNMMDDFKSSSNFVIMRRRSCPVCGWGAEGGLHAIESVSVSM